MAIESLIPINCDGFYDNIDFIFYIWISWLFFFLPHRKSNQTINGIHWIFNALDTRFGGYDRDAFADKKILSSWAFERNEIEYLEGKKKEFLFCFICSAA